MEPPIRNCLIALERLLAHAGGFAAGPQGNPARALQDLRAIADGADWPPRFVAAAASAKSKVDYLRRCATAAPQREALEAFAAACTALDGWSPLLQLHLDPATDLRQSFETNDPSLPSDLEDAVQRVAGTDLESRLSDAALHLLDAPPCAAPEPRASHFSVEWSGTVQREELISRDADGLSTTKLRDDAAVIGEADRCITRCMPDDDHAVFVAWTYSGVAAMTTARVVRRHWWRLATCGWSSDVLFFPGDAAWLIGYFHHGTAWVARRTGTELIRVTIGPAG